MIERGFLRCLPLVLVMCAMQSAGAKGELGVAYLVPALHSIRMVTISSEDPFHSAQRYRDLLAYEEVERGKIPEALAERWGSASLHGRPYVIIRSPGPDFGYIRFIKVETPGTYRPMTRSGWNALELLTRDPYEVFDRLKAARDFTHLDGPEALTPGSSIHAVQFEGPDKEVLYITADLGEGDKSTLARTKHLVGRPFIVVVAGADAQAIVDFYTQTFSLDEAFQLSIPIPLIARAQEVPETRPFDLSLLRLGAFSHSIEVDAYAHAPAKSKISGELPPGIAIVSFCGAGLGRATASYNELGIAYSSRLPEIYRGPASEMIELIDCAE